MDLFDCILYDNDCYKKNTVIKKVTGIVVHSTGTDGAKTTLKRWVQPSKSDPNYKELLNKIGVNKNGNSWNRSGVQKSVHAIIGELANGNIAVCHTLPYTMCCWGVGSGSKGSYNYNPQAHLQMELVEDGLTSDAYFNDVYNAAIEYCAYLCKKFSLDVSTICSHTEAYKAGYGSNHGDPEYWFKLHGKTMATFRRDVLAKIEGGNNIDDVKHDNTTETPVTYTVVKGDTIEKISKKYGVSVDAIIKANIAKYPKMTVDYIVVGWVLDIPATSQQVVDKEPEQPKFKEYYGKVTPSNGLNVRSGPGTGYSKIGALSYNTKVLIKEEKNGWGRISFNGKTGWVSLSYIKKV